MDSTVCESLFRREKQARFFQQRTAAIARPFARSLAHMMSQRASESRRRRRVRVCPASECVLHYRKTTMAQTSGRLVRFLPMAIHTPQQESQQTNSNPNSNFHVHH